MATHVRKQATCRTVLLVCCVAAVLLLQRVEGQHGELSDRQDRHHVSHLMSGGLGHPLHLLRYCRYILGDLTHGQIHQLRDVVQTMQYQTRLMREHEIRLERRHQTPESSGWALAYNDSMPDEEHKRLQEKHRAARDALQKTAEEMLQVHQKEGRVKEDVALRNMTNCVMGRLDPHHFPYQPTVSFMLQYNGRHWVIESWVKQAQLCGNHTELVVNVDNFDEHEQWAEVVNRTHGFVVPVFSANVREPRAYNRLSELARGKYLVIVQDDELPKDLECKWLPDVIRLFEAWPGIGAVGHRSFVWDRLSSEAHDHAHPSSGLFFRDPRTKIPMHFAEHVDLAPLTVRKSVFRSLGGLDETAGEPGECGLWSDRDFSNRIWAAGWQLAYYQVEVRSDGHDGGTHKLKKDERCLGRQGFLGKSHFEDRWHWNDTLSRHVRHLNLHLLEATYQDCPFAGGCDVSKYAPESTPHR